MTSRTLIRLAAAAALAALVAPALADGNAGSYLAARQAGLDNDYEAAARYYARAIVRDPKNVVLLENAVTAYLGLGDVERAVPVAERILQLGEPTQVATLALVVDEVKDENWEAVIAGFDEGRSVGPLYDDLVRAWSLVGLGRMSDALVQFDKIAKAQGIQAFGLYHKALALASVGDFEGASAVLSGEGGPQLSLTRRGLMARAQILSQIDRQADAIKMLQSVFGPDYDPEVQDVLTRLEAGEALPFTAVTSARDGVAEVNFSVAGALNGEASDSFTLIYARLAAYLRPDHTDAVLLTARILENLGRYELATDVYRMVPPDHLLFHAAELGRADALRDSGRVEEAIEVLRQLSETHGTLPGVHIALGDLLRRNERYAEALPAYSRAIELIGAPDEGYWGVFFSRAIAYEREDQWDKAEADFRKALELRPDQPQVLNYLGYSLVEMQTNLDEALDMIERAVAGQPDSGYITDSLGWVLYRLGRYDEAVGHMERAVELEPIDPIVNDHLGDVYWAVGRHREAEFQWHRALSFIDEDTDLSDVNPDRIRRKLEVGLDKVLEEEGAEPLDVAHDG